MYLYVYWPFGSTKPSGGNNFIACKTKQRAADFAIAQLNSLVAQGEPKIKGDKVKAINAPLAGVGEYVEEAHQDEGFPQYDDGADLVEHAVAPYDNGVVNMDHPTPARKLSPKKKTIIPLSEEFIALRKEVVAAENDKSFDNAMRLIKLFETYQGGRGRRSILHTIQEVKVVQEIAPIP